MLLLLGLACAAARAAPTSLRVLNDELDGYFRRRLDGEGLEPAPANGTAPLFPETFEYVHKGLVVGLERARS